MKSRAAADWLVMPEFVRKLEAVVADTRVAATRTADLVSEFICCFVVLCFFCYYLLFLFLALPLPSFLGFVLPSSPHAFLIFCVLQVV